MLKNITDKTINAAVSSSLSLAKATTQSVAYVGRQVANHEKVKPTLDSAKETAGDIAALAVIGAGASLTAACLPVGLAVAPEVIGLAAGIKSATRKDKK